MALFVFMVFVLLGRARSSEGLSAGQKKVQLFAYSVVWISIFALAAMIVLIWWRMNFPSEFVVRGTIRNLTYPEVITTDEEVFLHRRTVAGLDFVYEWRFISSHRFTGTVELLLQKKPADVKVLRYELPIREDFYDGLVDISYDQKTDKMILTHSGKQEELAPSAAQVPGEVSTRRKVNVLPPKTVYAAELPQAKVNELILALDADDPQIRAAARRDLIKLGQASIPLLDHALTDSESSYRLRVGALSTLQGLRDKAEKSLSREAKCAIAQASKDADPTLSAEASRLIAGGLTVPRDCTQRAGTDDTANPGCIVMKVENRELVPFRFQHDTIYVYLAGQSPSTPDKADIFLFSAGLWSGDRREISKKAFRSRITQMDAGAYVENKLENKKSFVATLEGKRYSATVETHYMRDFAVITVCRYP